MHIPPHIFREYDIRGIVGDDLTEAATELVGRAFGTELAGRASPGVVVGHDNRPSSPDLAAALCRGLCSAGVDVTTVGTVPTPALYFAAIEFGTDAGIQITGSHNPPEYNGIKMVRDGGALYGDSIRALRTRIDAGDFASGSRGEVAEKDILDRYVEEIATRGRVEGDVRMVLDCGNGAGSVVAVRALTAAGIDVDGLYCESDGTFPNHHPDPTVDEYVQDLITRVRATGADLGVGLDGDADRIGAVTEEGTIIRGDHLLLLFAREVLAERPGAEVVFDVKCSQALPQVIRADGGIPVMWKTGHSLIKERMRAGGSPVAGEMSGHICFADRFFGTDDAIYAAARLAGLVARSGRPLSELAAEIPSYPATPELRLECPEDRKFAVVAEAVRFFRERHEVIDIDGARVLLDGGWLLIRASNTQPVIVARIEADTEERMREIAAVARSFLADQGVALPTV
ncbi:phosphomannomutase/phosphoglucomutase [Candidatus Palauibacter sp.]|uniref:phosphomannomutase/phosphoglucomutase n=1 Tax=Candidatus Palauibacter sp. TaxID=3101350 RepID=UPI003AF1F69C